MRKLTIFITIGLIVLGFAVAVDSYHTRAVAAPTTTVQDRQKQLSDWQANLKRWEARTQKDTKSKAATTQTDSQGQGADVLPNTGPGQPISLFVGTTILGGLSHYLVSRRSRHQRI